MAHETQLPIHGVLMVTDPDSVVTLKVTIGKSGQEGSTAIYLGNQDLGDHMNTFSLDLGIAKDIEGKLLHCSTTIIDVDQTHNDLLFRIQLTAGNDIFYEHREKSMSAQNDSISVSSFIITITA